MIRSERPNPRAYLPRLVTWPLVAAVLAGCVSEPISRSASDNPNVPVAKLLTIEGCVVYRFSDGGEFIYVTICPSGRETSTTHMDQRTRTTSTGKTTTTTTYTVPITVEAKERMP